MKGAQNEYGVDNLGVILVSSGGHTERSIGKADDCISRYGMEAYPRIRCTNDEFADQVAAWFGHHSYGQIVIDKKGVLLGVNVNERDLSKLLDQALRSSASGRAPEGFAIKAAVKDLKGGRDGFSNTLTSKMTGTLELTLELPKGWHTYGAVEGADFPTTVEVAYADGVILGDVVLPTADDGSPLQEITGPVVIQIPVSLAKGSVIGRFYVHGTVTFVACNERGCLPPMELPWRAVIKAL